MVYVYEWDWCIDNRWHIRFLLFEDRAMIHIIGEEPEDAVADITIDFAKLIRFDVYEDIKSWFEEYNIGLKPNVCIDRVLPEMYQLFAYRRCI